MRGVLTDGFDSTVSSMGTVFPGARLGFCLRHALTKLPRKLIGVSASVRQGLRSTFHALLHRCRQQKSPHSTLAFALRGRMDYGRVACKTRSG
jgi:hypothetical protein